MQYQTREFSVLLNEMHNRPGYRPSCQKVFLALHELENAITGSTQPAQGVIARRKNMHRVTVNKAVAWLRLNGFIRTMQRAKRRVGGAGWWFQSLRYWVARELGQVAYLETLEKLRRLKKWLNGEKRPKSSCSRNATAPSSSEYYSDSFMSPKQKKNALEGVKRQC
jgi:hypothetical protein